MGMLARSGGWQICHIVATARSAFCLRVAAGRARVGAMQISGTTSVSIFIFRQANASTRHRRRFIPLAPIPPQSQPRLVGLLGTIRLLWAAVHGDQGWEIPQFWGIHKAASSIPQVLGVSPKSSPKYTWGIGGFGGRLGGSPKS
jgi:hypothetical protein